MPNWNEILNEIVNTPEQNGVSPFDIVRRKYLSSLSAKTGRCVIAYYSGFLSKPNVYGTQINDEDKNGFMLCCSDIDRSTGLDLILHTQGGNLYATDSIIHYLREMFGDDIRAIVPQISMSAGTMIAASCKSILLGKHSNLGPVDPQINNIPAHAIRAQFDRAYSEIKADPRTAPVWAPMLRQLGVSFVKQCDWAIDYAKDFVVTALTRNMFRDDADVATKAPRVAEVLSDLGKNKSHERHFHYQECIDMGLKIEMIEEDPDLQDLILTVHHCYMHVRSNTNATKIIENHIGNALFKQVNQQAPQGLAINIGQPNGQV